MGTSQGGSSCSHEEAIRRRLSAVWAATYQQTILSKTLERKQIPVRESSGLTTTFEMKGPTARLMHVTRARAVLSFCHQPPERYHSPPEPHTTAPGPAGQGPHYAAVQV